MGSVNLPRSSKAEESSLIFVSHCKLAPPHCDMGGAWKLLVHIEQVQNPTHHSWLSILEHLGVRDS